MDDPANSYCHWVFRSGPACRQCCRERKYRVVDWNFQGKRGRQKNPLKS